MKEDKKYELTYTAPFTEDKMREVFSKVMFGMNDPMNSEELVNGLVDIRAYADKKQWLGHLDTICSTIVSSGNAASCTDSLGALYVLRQSLSNILDSLEVY